jgi:hypothetical protein
MSRDIFEQLVEDYYVSIPGWFVKHNIKYRPSDKHPEYNKKTDSNFSDIDIMAINVKQKKLNTVHVISCKSWQGGFGIKDWLEVLKEEKEIKGKANQKTFKEIILNAWIDSYLDILERETGQKDFTYIIACTKIKEKGDEKKDIEDCEIIINKFKERESNIKIEFLTLDEIINNMNERIKNQKTKTTEPTDTGRIIQLFNDAKLLLTQK